jgi:hypothetical protein
MIKIILEKKNSSELQIVQNNEIQNHINEISQLQSSINKLILTSPPNKINFLKDSDS